jgi:phosphoadenosine phosphosulfate reductase
VSDHKFSGDLDGFADWQQEALAAKMRKRVKNLNQDQFAPQGETQVRCINGKDKIIVNPIIEWTDADVWEFLNKVVQVPHCELYEKGYHRIGCILCPMASVATKMQFIHDYPKFVAAYKRAMIALVQKNPKTAEILQPYVHSKDELVDRLFDWWVSGLSWAEFIDRTFSPKLNFEQ